LTQRGSAANPLSVSSETISSSSSPRRGVEFAEVIDMIMHDAQTDEAVLIMVETREWDDSEERLFQLQEKFNAYMSFALDGEMADAYPSLAGKPLRLQLESTHMPAPAALDLLQKIHDQVGFQGIKLEVRVKAPLADGCGPECGCTDES
jgi:hypothetical protein